ncbi:MAG TPA: methyltransferase domain-containing protein [Candidatus Bathyarchaeia archaeon]|nr:methyltransferase domain-containing protein [Candidatus Bathyarchaeia archaeon]
MKPDLLELLECPACRAPGPFSLLDPQADPYEIVRAQIRCDACSASFPVRHGYCDLLHNPSEPVRRELAAQLEIERRGPPPDPAAAAASILRLPDGNPDAVEHAPLVRYAVSALCPRGDETVLDLGAGLGWTSALFARAGCRCVLVDIYSTVLEAGRCFAQNGAYFDRLLTDMSRLPLRPDAFDAVFANAAIHHTPDLDATLREAARVLKPGGRLMFVNEPVVGRWETRRPAEFGADYRKDGICERAYTTPQWRHAFRQAKLTPAFKILDVGFDEKIRHRADLPAYARFPRKQALALLRNAPARRCMLRLFAPIALELYPFNVILAAQKPQ